MKKYTKQDQKSLATWAADCAERVLSLFEKPFPKDDRPRQAIVACRTWVRTGIFKMAAIRIASLSAHAAARDAKPNDPACFAARAAGHSVATVHVPQHAFGSAYYALKALAAANPANPNPKVTREYHRQYRRLPKHLQPHFQKIIQLETHPKALSIKLQKNKNF